MKVAQKKDYASGELTEGAVKDVLTKKQFHPRGHKVRLTNGMIGRVQEFADQDGSKEEALVINYKPSEDDLL